MSAESNKALVRRHYEEVLNGKNVAVIDKLYAPVIALGDGASMEREQFKAVVGMMHAAFQTWRSRPMTRSPRETK
jgi:hypothetical protein